MKKANIFGLFWLLALSALVVAPVIFAAGNEEAVNQMEADADGQDVALIGLGVVAKVDAESLVLVEYEYESDEELEVSYQVNDRTQFDNIASLADLQPGDSVEVVYADEAGKKVALAISKEENYIEDDQIEIEEVVVPTGNQELVDIEVKETITISPANTIGQ